MSKIKYIVGSFFAAAAAISNIQAMDFFEPQPGKDFASIIKNIWDLKTQSNDLSSAIDTLSTQLKEDHSLANLRIGFLNYSVLYSVINLMGTNPFWGNEELTKKLKDLATLMLDCGADPNADFQMPPNEKMFEDYVKDHSVLFMAVDHPDLVKLMIEKYKGDFTKKDTDGWNLFAYALNHGQKEVAEYVAKINPEDTKAMLAIFLLQEKPNVDTDLMMFLKQELDM